MCVHTYTIQHKDTPQFVGYVLAASRGFRVGLDGVREMTA